MYKPDKLAAYICIQADGILIIIKNIAIISKKSNFNSNNKPLFKYNVLVLYFIYT